MGIDVDRFTQKIDQEFICGICHDVLEDALVTSCEHAYCRDCVTPMLRHRSTCPNCRTFIQPNKLKPLMRMVKNMIDKMELRCDYVERGCTDVQRLDGLPSHLEKCGFFPVHCPHVGCSHAHGSGSDLNRQDLDEHLGSCGWRLVECPHGCGEHYPFLETEQHEGVCRRKPVLCPQGCGQMVVREEAAEHIKADCARTPVPCKVPGCPFQADRGNLEGWGHHMSDAQGEHTLCLLATIGTMQQGFDKRLDEARGEIRELREECDKLRELVREGRVDFSKSKTLNQTSQAGKAPPRPGMIKSRAPGTAVKFTRKVTGAGQLVEGEELLFVITSSYNYPSKIRKQNESFVFYVKELRRGNPPCNVTFPDGQAYWVEYTDIIASTKGKDLGSTVGAAAQEVEGEEDAIRPAR